MEKATAYKVSKGWLVIGATHLDAFERDHFEVEIDIAKNEMETFSYKELRNAGIMERHYEKSARQKDYCPDYRLHDAFKKEFAVPEIKNILQFISLLED